MKSEVVNVLQAALNANTKAHQTLALSIKRMKSELPFNGYIVMFANLDEVLEEHKAEESKLLECIKWIEAQK